METAVVGGKYRLEGRIGAGATSVVYAGVHLGTGREIAVKRLLPTRAHDDVAIARFEREARAAGAIRSSHVVEILDVDRDEDGLPYLVLERLFGETLEQRLEQRSRLQVTEAIAILDQVLEGVADLHAAGVVHRDLKPANVFLTEDDGEVVVKLVDLGVAKISQASLDDEITRTDETIGTLAFMAPEQLKREVDASPSSDLWSVGVILYRMLSGRNPFAASDPMSLLAMILEQPAAPLQQGIPYGEGLQAFLDRVFEKDPRDRYADAGAMREALQRVLGDEGLRVQIAPPLLRRSPAGRQSLTDEEPTRPQETTTAEGEAPTPLKVDRSRRDPAAREPELVPKTPRMEQLAPAPDSPRPAVASIAPPPPAPAIDGTSSPRWAAWLAVLAAGAFAGWLLGGLARHRSATPVFESDPPDAHVEQSGGRAKVSARDRDAREIDLPDRPGVTMIVRLPRVSNAPVVTSEPPPVATIEPSPPSATASDTAPAPSAEPKEERVHEGGHRPHPTAGPSSHKPPVIHEPPY